MVLSDNLANLADRLLVTIHSRSSWVFRLPAEAASRRKPSERNNVCFFPVQSSFYRAIPGSIDSKKLLWEL